MKINLFPGEGRGPEVRSALKDQRLKPGPRRGTVAQ